MATSPREAEIILFIEPHGRKTADYVTRLLGNALIRDYPEKCFTFDSQPEPTGLLPGVYASLPRRRLNPARYRPGSYLFMPNEVYLRPGTDPESAHPPYLFSFRGSRRSNLIRGALLDAGFEGPEITITETHQWFDHGQEEKDRYGKEIEDSKFVLCPRGIATSSYRMYETMAQGRVPVILSDAWAAPEGVAWGECALWVAEDRIAELPEILRRQEPEWRTLGRRARQEWERRFHPDIALYWTLRSIEEIRLFRGASHDEREWQHRWRSWAVAWENRWTLPQRVAAAARMSRLAKRTKG
ncbi:MAG: exostosin family protein [Cytophagales bacterium]|nr:exostosin family protein [Armatimonadota bacterium]